MVQVQILQLIQIILNHIIKYSIDFGTTWITVPSNGVITNISNGNVIMVKLIQ